MFLFYYFKSEAYNMTKKIIKTISLVVGVGITIVIGSIIPQEDIKSIDISWVEFNIKNIGEATATSTKTRTIKYATFDYSTTTKEFKVVEKEQAIAVSLDGYKRCVKAIENTTTTVVYCDEELERQMDLNEQWFLEGERGRLEQLKLEHYKGQ